MLRLSPHHDRHESGYDRRGYGRRHENDHDGVHQAHMQVWSE